MGSCVQPRSQVLSPTRRETLAGSGHVSPRIWEITNKRLGGGADKCEICLYKGAPGVYYVIYGNYKHIYIQEISKRLASVTGSPGWSRTQPELIV